MVLSQRFSPLLTGSVVDISHRYQAVERHCDTIGGGGRRAMSDGRRETALPPAGTIFACWVLVRLQTDNIPKLFRFRNLKCGL